MPPRSISTNRRPIRSDDVSRDYGLEADWLTSAIYIRNTSFLSSIFSVDLNRNFDYHWGGKPEEVYLNARLKKASLSIGLDTTDNPCDREVYRGPRAFSEVELQNLKSYLDSLPIPPILGLSIHCCYGWILLPYGYDYNVFPENYEEIVRRDDR